MTLPSVFLSHSHKDKAFARQLGEKLRLHGIKVWIDEAEIKVGESLIAKLSQGIAAVDYIAAILSPESVASPWVQRELEIAMTLEIEGRRRKVLPVLYRECNIPPFLIGKLWADFRDINRFSDSLEHLLAGIRPPDFEKEILDAVRAGIAAACRAFRALPTIDDKVLDGHYTKSGSGRERIVHLLREHSRKGWTISDKGNPSTYDVYRISIREIRDAWANVETEEYWYLRWCDTTKQRHPPIYNVRNVQQYSLQRQDDGTWLIDTNYYPGKARQKFIKKLFELWERLFVGKTSK